MQSLQPSWQSLRTPVSWQLAAHDRLVTDLKALHFVHVVNSRMWSPATSADLVHMLSATTSCGTAVRR